MAKLQKRSTKKLLEKTMENKSHHNLLEILELQQDMIDRQNDLIAELTNENAEKENMINVLMNEFAE